MIGIGLIENRLVRRRDRGQTIAVREEAADAMTRVRLLGVASFNPHWDAAAKERLDSLLAGQAVVLHLEPTQTRDEQGDFAGVCDARGRDAGQRQIVREGLALGGPAGEVRV